MSDLPGFFSQFKEPEVEPPQPVLADPVNEKTHQNPSSGRTRSFTVRDWEILDFLKGDPTNGEIAEHFRIGRAAASSRVKRLANMGLIALTYENASDTGQVNERHIEVLIFPPKPWSAE